jgi:hypothetical protein
MPRSKRPFWRPTKQGSSGRHVSPVQAEAPHQGRDRQRGALADLLLAQPENDPQAVAVPFINPDKEVADAAAASCKIA